MFTIIIVVTAILAGSSPMILFGVITPPKAAVLQQFRVKNISIDKKTQNRWKVISNAQDVEGVTKFSVVAIEMEYEISDNKTGNMAYAFSS